MLIDSTGIKSSNDGEYRSTKYGKVKVWTKIHIAIDRKTHRILNIIITDSGVSDPTEFSTKDLIWYPGLFFHLLLKAVVYNTFLV